MAKTYIGVSGKAREVSGFWVGVSGVARKVVRGWVGVGGKARLFYESDFWTAGGISTANCLAAYQFKGASSETVARTDLTGHGHTLTKWSSTSGKLAPSWSKANGFYIGATASDYGINPTLYNTTLNGKAIKSIVIRYDGFSASSLDGHSIVLAPGSDGYAGLWIDGGPRSSNWPGTSSGRTNNPVIRKNTSTILWASTTAAASGTIGMTAKSAIYKNGTAMTLTEVTENTSTGYFPITAPGDRYTIWLPRLANFKVYAAAFYSVNLTAAQHKAVSNAMLKL